MAKDRTGWRLQVDAAVAEAEGVEQQVMVHRDAHRYSVERRAVECHLDD